MLTTSGTILATAFTGCTGYGETQGTPVKFDVGHMKRPPNNEYLEIVAVAEDTRDGPEGTFTGSGTVYEWPSRGQLILWTEYGARSNQESGWEHTVCSELHDWSVSDISETVIWHDSNLVSTGDDQAVARRSDKSKSNTGRWRIELDPATGRPTTYLFTTWVSEASGASPGDTIAATSSTARFSNSDTEREQELELVFTFGKTEK